MEVVERRRKEIEVEEMKCRTLLGYPTRSLLFPLLGHLSLAYLGLSLYRLPFILFPSRGQLVEAEASLKFEDNGCTIITNARYSKHVYSM